MKLRALLAAALLAHPMRAERGTAPSLFGAPVAPRETIRETERGEALVSPRTERKTLAWLAAFKMLRGRG